MTTAPPPDAHGDGLAAALAALERLYDGLERELSARAVRCDLRGLCCDFARSGLALFATDLEVEHARRHGGAEPPAAAPGCCPFFAQGRCGLRQGRPLGCRVYYCDPGFADEMTALAERYHRAIVQLHERHGVPYRYAPFVDAIRRR